MEQWKAIPGFEGYYEASTLGNIRSVSRKVIIHGASGDYERSLKSKPMTPLPDGKGYYLMVELSRDGRSKRYLIHRLVAQTFIENPESLPEVNHKDENKRNNRVDNLEWCTHAYNNNYGSKKTASRGEGNAQCKFSEATILELKRQYKPNDPEFGTKGLSEKFGISISHVSAIIHGRRWGWL